MPAMTARSTDPRTIVVLVGSATAISLVGHVADLKGSVTTVVAKRSPALGDAQILLGGTAAAVILVLLSQAGDVGAEPLELVVRRVLRDGRRGAPGELGPQSANRSPDRERPPELPTQCRGPGSPLHSPCQDVGFICPFVLIDPI